MAKKWNSEGVHYLQTMSVVSSAVSELIDAFWSGSTYPAEVFQLLEQHAATGFDELYEPIEDELATFIDSKEEEEVRIAVVMQLEGLVDGPKMGRKRPMHRLCGSRKQTMRCYMKMLDWYPTQTLAELSGNLKYMSDVCSVQFLTALFEACLKELAGGEDSSSLMHMFMWTVLHTKVDVSNLNLSADALARASTAIRKIAPLSLDEGIRLRGFLRGNPGADSREMRVALYEACPEPSGGKINDIFKVNDDLPTKSDAKAWGHRVIAAITKAARPPTFSTQREWNGTRLYAIQMADKLIEAARDE